MTIVYLTPIKGNQIKFRVRGEVVCHRFTETTLQNSLTGPALYSSWSRVFKSKVQFKRFIAKGKTIRVNIPLSWLGYDSCDSLRGSKIKGKF